MTQLSKAELEEYITQAIANMHNSSDVVHIPTEIPDIETGAYLNGTSEMDTIQAASNQFEGQLGAVVHGANTDNIKIVGDSVKIIDQMFVIFNILDKAEHAARVNQGSEIAVESAINEVISGAVDNTTAAAIRMMGGALVTAGISASADPSPINETVILLGSVIGSQVMSHGEQVVDVLFDPDNPERFGAYYLTEDPHGNNTWARDIVTTDYGPGPPGMNVITQTETKYETDAEINALLYARYEFSRQTQGTLYDEADNRLIDLGSDGVMYQDGNGGYRFYGQNGEIINRDAQGNLSTYVRHNGQVYEVPVSADGGVDISAAVSVNENILSYNAPHEINKDAISIQSIDYTINGIEQEIESLKSSSDSPIRISGLQTTLDSMYDLRTKTESKYDSPDGMCVDLTTIPTIANNDSVKQEVVNYPNGSTVITYNYGDGSSHTEAFIVSGGGIVHSKETVSADGETVRYSNVQDGKFIGNIVENERFYTVKEGDTLSEIAQQQGIDYDQLLEQNPHLADNPDLIHPGDKVNLNNKENSVMAPNNELGHIVGEGVGDDTGLGWNLTQHPDFIPASWSQDGSENGTVIFTEEQRVAFSEIGINLDVIDHLADIQGVENSELLIDIHDMTLALGISPREALDQAVLFSGDVQEAQKWAKVKDQYASVNDADNDAIDQSAIGDGKGYGGDGILFDDDTFAEGFIDFDPLPPEQYDEVSAAGTEASTVNLTQDQIDSVNGFVSAIGTVNTLQGLGSALRSGDDAQVFVGLANAAADGYAALDTADDDVTANLNVVASAANFYNAIEGGDGIDIAVSGIDLINSFDAMDGQGGEVLGASGGQEAVAVLNLAGAIDSGDGVDIALATLSAVDTFSDGAVQSAVNGAVGVEAGANVPYIAWVRAGIQLADGETGEAAFTVASAYFMQAAMATGNPYIIIGAFIFTIFAGKSLEAPPFGELEFVENSEGVFEGVASGDDGVRDFLHEMGGGYSEFLNGLRASGFDFGADDVPTIDFYGESLYFDNAPAGSSAYARTQFSKTGDEDFDNETNGRIVVDIIRGNQVYTEISGVLDSAGINGTFSERFNYLVGVGSESVSSAELGAIKSGLAAKGYEMIVYPDGAIGIRTGGGPTGSIDLSGSVYGTGVYHYGIQEYSAPVNIGAAQIESVATPRKIPAQELKEVTQTWGVNGQIFSGDQGAYLAMGVGLGMISLEALGEIRLSSPTPVSLLEHEDFAEAIANSQDSVMVAGYGLLSLGTDAQNDLIAGPTDYYNSDFSSTYVPGTTQAIDDSAYTVDLASLSATGQGPEVDAASAVYASYVNRDGINLLADETETDTPDSSANVAVSNPDISGQLIRDLSAPNATVTPDFSNFKLPFEDAEMMAKVQADPAFSAAARQGASDYFAMLEDRELYTTTEELIANDGEGVTFIGLEDAAYGTVTLEANGEILFTPDPDYAGVAGFDYKIRTADGVEKTMSVQINVENINDRPDAVDDIASEDTARLQLVEDTALSLNILLSNDTDPDGDPLSLAAVSQVSHGTVSINSNGEFIYTPETDYVGTVDIVYVVQDPSGANSVARATIEYVDGGNEAPVVVTDVFTDAIEDTSYTLNTADLLVNDRDPESSTLSITDVSVIDPSQGTVQFDPITGDITVTPADNFYGDLRLSYTAAEEANQTDPSQPTLTSQGSAVISFANTADTFTAGNSAITISEDEITIFPPGALFKDINNVDSDEVTITAVRMVGGEVGIVDLMPDGSVRFIPGPEFSGETAFEIRLSNGMERIASRVDVTVTAENDAPTTADDRFTDGWEDTAYTLNVSDLTDNDTDHEGDSFRVTNVQLADSSQGTLNWNQSSGQIEITPAADFFGEIALTYTATETGGAGLSNNGTATVYFTNVNDDFSTSNKAFNIQEDETAVFTPSMLLDSLQDIDGEEISISAVRLQNPDAGTLTLLSNGSVRLTPATDYTDEIRFEMDVTDGVTTKTTSVEVGIDGANDAPTTTDDYLTDGTEDTVYQLNASDLLSNDRDAEGATLKMVDIALVDPSQGTVTLDQVTGEITVTPAADVNGTIQLTYTVNEDGGGLQSTGQVSIQLAATNDTIALSDQSFVIDEDEVHIFTRTALFGANEDADGETLTIVNPALSNADAGTLEVMGNGDLRFMPTAGYSGDVQFTMEVDDGNTENIAPVAFNMAVTVTAINDAPVGEMHQFTGGVEEQVFMLNAEDLKQNASDEEDHSISLTAVEATDPTTGSVQFDIATGEIKFTPAADFFGAAQLTYTLQDSEGATSQNQATIEFANVDDTFSVANQSFVLNEDEIRIFTSEALFGQTTDADGAVLQMSNPALADPAAGSLEILDSGNLRFTPTAEYAGNTSFTLDVDDGVTTQSVTMELSVTAENDAPTAGKDVFNDAVEDTTYTFQVEDLLANDNDAENNDFIFSGITLTNPDAGTVFWNRENGEVTLTPAENFSGEARLEYTLVETGTNLEATGSASVVFASVNDTQEITDKDYKDQRFNLFEDEAKIFTADILLDRLVDVDGEKLRITNVTMNDASQGTVRVTKSGDVQFTPAKDMVGEVSFSIEVTDGVAPTTADFTVKLWPLNDGPTVADDAYKMTEDTVLSVSGAELLSNDTADGEDNSLQITGIFETSNGTASYDPATDQLTFDPGKDVFGPAWIDYIVEDSKGGWSTARLNVSIGGTEDAVIAMDDQITLGEDVSRIISARELLDNDLNPDQGALKVVSIDTSTIQSGSLNINQNGDLAYTATTNFSGNQTFSYTVEDTNGNQSTAQATLSIIAENDAPEVQLTTTSILEDTGVTFKVSDLLNNATDAEDDWMHIAGARTQYGEVDYDEYTGQIHYTPTENFNSFLYGEAAVVEYLVVDEVGAETWAAINIDVSPVNDPPKAFDDTLYAWSSGPGGYNNPHLGSWNTANDVEVDGEAIWVSEVTSASNGAVTLNPTTGLITYTSNTDFVGVDEYTYTVTDGVVIDGVPSQDTATVSVNVLENHAPTSSDLATEAREDTILNFGIEDFMPYIYDEDLGLAELPEYHQIVSVGNATNGTVVRNDDGSVSFRPDQDYNSVQHGGVATFDFVVADIVGNLSNVSTASIVYTPVNDDPTAITKNITQTVKEEQVANIDINAIMKGNYDVDGDEVFFDGGVRAAHGNVYVSGGNIVYTGHKDFYGSETIFYNITDNNGGSDVGRINFNVQNVNDPPTTHEDRVRGYDNVTNKVSIASLVRNDQDVDGDSLTVSRILGFIGGNAYMQGGFLHFNASGPGTATVNYMVSDGTDETFSKLTLDIMHVNEAPILQSFSSTPPHKFGGSVLTTGVFKAIDPDSSDNIVYTVIDNGSTGGVEINPHTGEFKINGVETKHADVGNDGLNKTLKTTTIGLQASDTEGGLFQYYQQVQYAEYYRAQGAGGKAPIVFDLNDDGLNLVSHKVSNAYYDWDSDNDLDRTGWIAGEGDAILAYDHDGDGVIKLENEISFVGYLEGAQTDLEGLNAFDTNQDGTFSAEDAAWQEFGLWVDDGDALSEDGEFLSLDEMGVASIDLTSDGNLQMMNGNTIHGEAGFTFTDGTEGTIGDVAFAISENFSELEEQTLEDYPVDVIAGQTGLSEQLSEIDGAIEFAQDVSYIEMIEVAGNDTFNDESLEANQDNETSAQTDTTNETGLPGWTSDVVETYPSWFNNTPDIINTPVFTNTVDYDEGKPEVVLDRTCATPIPYKVIVTSEETSHNNSYHDSAYIPEMSTEMPYEPYAESKPEVVFDRTCGTMMTKPIPREYDREVSVTRDWHNNKTLAVAPVLFDINRDGLNLFGYDKNDARYDWEANYSAEHAEWVSETKSQLSAQGNAGFANVANGGSFVNYLDRSDFNAGDLGVFGGNTNDQFSANDDVWQTSYEEAMNPEATSDLKEYLSLVRADTIKDIDNDSVMQTQGHVSLDGAAQSSAGIANQDFAKDLSSRLRQIEEDADSANRESTKEKSVYPREDESDIENQETANVNKEASVTKRQNANDKEDADKDNAGTGEDLLADDPSKNEEALASIAADETQIEGDDLGFDLPSDEEMDAIAAQGVQVAASMPAEESVAASDDNPDAIPSTSTTVEDDFSAVG